MCTQENILPFKVGKWDLNSHKISFYLNFISSVQSLSHVWLFVTPWTAARRASLSITNSQNLLKLMSIELVRPSNHLIFIFWANLCSFLSIGLAKKFVWIFP